MSIDVDKLRIIHYPKPVLREKAKPVHEVNDQVRRVAVRMLQLMHQAPGVGLAAPQVGLPWRLFVANHTGESGDDMVFINPSLTEPARDTDVRNEGCLSLPGIEGDINRPGAITISALDIHGLPFKRSASDLEARVWQHENDHLDGILIIDRMKKIDRTANKRALRNLEQAAKK